MSQDRKKDNSIANGKNQLLDNAYKKTSEVLKKALLYSIENNKNKNKNINKN